MQFRLLYHGRLLGASKDKTRAPHKHDIRKKLSPQLKRLWEENPNLRQYRRRLGGLYLTQHPEPDIPKEQAIAERFFEDRGLRGLSEKHERARQKLIPLVTEEMGLRCKIEILFLRPGIPGRVIQSGDIDNRIKTLFDALRIPRDAQELDGVIDEPIYCLLEDDRLISELKVVTDNLLLLPDEADIDANDVFLVLDVSLEAPPNSVYGYIFG